MTRRREPLRSAAGGAALLALGATLGLAFGRLGEMPRAGANPTPATAVASEAGGDDSAAPATRRNAKIAADAVKTPLDDQAYAELARQYEKFAVIDRTYQLVSRAVSPSVVHIVATKSSRGEDAGRARRYEETGSGVIVRASRGSELYVLTNNHVVEKTTAPKVEILLKDGRALHPKAMWLDAKADIAVLALDRDDLPAARLGNSDDAVVGTWVLAMGSPFGLMHSVSQGIISARGRHMEELADVENQDFLQTDAAINPGNSGGPLVNMKGEVIGINNSIASNGGGNEGVGFSIPINLAKWIMEELLAHGHVNRGALGVRLHPDFRPEDAVRLGLERPAGAWVDSVEPGSPAATAGLRDGDVILRFNAVEINDLNHLINIVSMSAIGRPAEVVVWRGRKLVNLNVTVGDKDREVAGNDDDAGVPRVEHAGASRRPERTGSSSSARGLELATLDEAGARRFGLPDDLRGAVVTKIDPKSPVAKLLDRLDVIVSIDGKAVADAEQAFSEISRHSAAEALILGVDRVVRGAIERRSVRLP